MPKRGCIQNGPKQPRYLDIYRFYFFNIGQDVTIRSCIPYLDQQAPKNSNYLTIQYGRYLNLNYLR